MRHGTGNRLGVPGPPGNVSAAISRMNRSVRVSKSGSMNESVWQNCAGISILARRRLR